MKRIAALAVLILPMELALAHDGATGIVKERMDAMKAIGKSTKTLSQMLRGERDFDADIAKTAAAVIEQQSSLSVDLYPAGSKTHPSEAAVAIWEKPDEFEAEFVDLETAARNLRLALKTATEAGAMEPQFAVIAKSCKSCHSGFRQKN